MSRDITYLLIDDNNWRYANLPPMQVIIERINATPWMTSAMHCSYGMIAVTISDHYTGDLLADIGIPVETIYAKHEGSIEIRKHWDARKGYSI